MGSDRLRVLVLALASILLLVLSALVLDWFRMTGPWKVAIDLREMRVCDIEGTCRAATVRGNYGTSGIITLWSSLIFACVVAYLGGSRALGATLDERFVRAGYTLGCGVFVIAGLTGWFFFDEQSANIAGIIEISFERTLAPSLMLLGCLLGIAALYYAANPPIAEAAYVPVVVEGGKRPGDPDSGLRVRIHPETGPIAKPRTTTPDRSRITGQVEPIAKSRTTTPDRERDRERERDRAGDRERERGRITTPPGEPPLKSRTTTPDRARITTPPNEQKRLTPPPGELALPRRKTPTSQPMPFPEGMRGKLAYAIAAAEITSGGVDARREAGEIVLVLWRDVVGVVARRLPPFYDSTTFIDLVSTAGSTLRVLPWTRLTGQPLEGGDEERGRSLIRLVSERCPNAKIDAATRSFLDGSEAAQLPDAATLKAHDERLA